LIIHINIYDLFEEKNQNQNYHQQTISLKKWRENNQELITKVQKEIQSEKENGLSENKSNKDFNQEYLKLFKENQRKIIELEQTILKLESEKKDLEDKFCEQEKQNQLIINEIKNNNESLLTKINEEAQEVISELLAIKKRDFEQIINDYKSRLEEVYHGYLEAFLEENSQIAKKNLLKKFDEKALKELTKLIKFK
jgi:hypothetical protein